MVRNKVWRRHQASAQTSAHLLDFTALDVQLQVLGEVTDEERRHFRVEVEVHHHVDGALQVACVDGGRQSDQLRHAAAKICDCTHLQGGVGAQQPCRWSAGQGGEGHSNPAGSQHWPCQQRRPSRQQGRAQSSWLNVCQTNIGIVVKGSATSANQQPTATQAQPGQRNTVLIQSSARRTRKRNAACGSAVQSVIPCGVPCLQNLATTCGMGDDRMTKSGKSPPRCQAACPLIVTQCKTTYMSRSKIRVESAARSSYSSNGLSSVAHILQGREHKTPAMSAKPGPPLPPRFPPTGHVQKTNTGSNRGNTSENVRQSSVDSKLRRCSVVTNLGQRTDSESSAQARTHTKHTHSS